MKPSTNEKVVIAVVVGALLLFVFMGGGRKLQHGFYTADYPEYGNTNDWYVASNAGVGGA
jgi:hypothetical protein